MTQTRADRLHALEAQFKAKSTREMRADGTVVLALELESGDRFAGRGATTEEALTNLEARAAKLAAMEE